MEEHQLPQEFSRLPRDLLFEIFCKLPFKSLSILRCVSSTFFSFISSHNPYFISSYFHKHKLNPLLLSIQPLQFSFYFINGTLRCRFSAVSSAGALISALTCCGFLCLIYESKCLICDPVTREFSYLPRSTNFKNKYEFAFGYAPFTREFKILHLYNVKKFDNYHYGQVNELMCEILSIPRREIGSDHCKDWKFLGKCPFDVLGRKSYVYVNGKLYWLIAEKKFHPDSIRILQFDLGKELFGVVYFPKKCLNRSVECLGLVEIKDKLCLTDRLPWGSEMDIWVLENEPDNLWVKKFRVDFVGIDHHDLEIMGHLDSSNGCENDDGEILVKLEQRKLVLYDLGNGGFRELDCFCGQEKDFKLLIDRKNML